MTSSRQRVAVKRRERAVPRRSDGEYGALRPAFVYALAAILAVVAAEALRRDRDTSAADASSHRARVVHRRAPFAGGDDWGHAPSMPGYVPTASQVAREPPPRSADEQDEEAGISPEDWKMPPLPNPDPSARPAIDDVWPNKGPESGGQTVQIRGRNLEPVLVLFGRTPARILGISESDGDVTLTLVAPPRTGPAKEWIVVTNRDGNNATGQFEYYR